MQKCECEHWQICPICAPQCYDENGALKPPEPTPLQACSSALDALREAANEAAEHLLNEAAELKKAHTISGEWDGTAPEVMAKYEEILALANRLQSNDQDQRREASAGAKG